MPESSSTLDLSGSGIRSIPGASYVSRSLNNFLLEDMNIATAVIVPVTRRQARAVAVLWTSKTRIFGSSQTTTPSCSNARSKGPVPGISTGSGFSTLPRCQARDTLRWVGATPPQFSGGSAQPVPGNSQTRLSCSSARSTGSVPGTFQPRSTTPLVPSRSTPGTGSVRSSRDTFPLEDSPSLTI